MSVNLTIILFTLIPLFSWQHDAKLQSYYTVTLEETICAQTRRMRCSYHFAEGSAEKKRKGKRRFNTHFYIGADQVESKEDAISRLDRLFEVRREDSTDWKVENKGAVGYTRAVRLRVEGGKYEFSREDGEKIVVDIEKETRP